MKSKIFLRGLAAAHWLVVMALSAGTALAQEYRGRVQGMVGDPSHAAIANAKVTLRNVNTGIEVVRETDTAGHYLFDFVNPGIYSVAVEAPGFQRFVQENVTVLTGGDVTVNAALTVGAVNETVNVTAEVTPSAIQYIQHDDHGAGCHARGYPGSSAKPLHAGAAKPGRS